MTKFGKILAVFVATASLAFAGFAIATVFAGPNWLQMTEAGYLDYYKFARGPGPDYLWSATRIADGSQVASSKRLPEVISKVLDDVSQKNQQVLQTLNDREPLLQARVEALEKNKAADEKALQEYVDAQRARLEAVRKQEATLAAEIIAATNNASQLENQTAERRADVLRLKQQIEEVRADQFRLEAILKQQKNLLQQFEGDAAKVKSRKDSLEQQLKSRNAQ